jgi:hypothetical protein
MKFARDFLANELVGVLIILPIDLALLVQGMQSVVGLLRPFAMLVPACRPAGLHHRGVPDGRFTVFVPSASTPLAGAVYILTGDRVHPWTCHSRKPSSRSRGGDQVRESSSPRWKPGRP